MEGERQRERERERQTDRQTHRQTDRQRVESKRISVPRERVRKQTW